MTKYLAEMLATQIRERERRMSRSLYFIPFGEYRREDGELVKVEMKGETEKAYMVIVETKSRVVLFVPKSQSRIVEGGIIVKGWLFVKSAEFADAALLLGELLREVAE